MRESQVFTPGPGTLSALWIAVLATALLTGIAGPAAAQDPFTDADIEAAVDDALIRDPGVIADDVDVSARDGIVQLTGEVTNLRASQRATALAETVRGVRGVVNRISVAPAVRLGGETLARNVDAALFADPATQTADVTVTAGDDGVVTLSGTAPSWASKTLAARVAAGVYGVRGVRDDIAVAYEQDRSDAQIRDEIRARLAWDALVDDALVEIVVDAGRVTLEGVVGSAAERSRAYADAWVAGVRSVDSAGLEVARWAHDPALAGDKHAPKSDADIAAAIEAALRYDPRVAAFSIDPRVDDGIVTLFGVVSNPKARESAATDARNVVGVRRVRNRLKIRPVAQLPQEQVRENVTAALERDVFVDADQIDVEVDGRIVRLTGTVDSTFERAQAHDATFRARGVRSVVNDLDVRVPEIVGYSRYVDDGYVYDYDWYVPLGRRVTQSDSTIREEIESELFWSPFVDAERVRVGVDDGVATLQGTVSSWRARAIAADNALQAGATRVRNQLAVDGG